MGKRKNRAQLEAELRQLKSTKLASGTVQVITHLIRWGALMFFFWCFKETVVCLAGKNTFSDISIGLTTDFKMDKWVAYIFGTGGVGYGYLQRRLRKSTVENMHGRTKELEEKIDPKRSSSNLTSRGDTRPEDKE